jgi:sugar phosphate isomerase/epimerase
MEEETLKRAIMTLQSGPVKCRALNSFCAPSLILCGPGYVPDAVADYCSALAERAYQLGIAYIGVGAPKSRSIPDGFSSAVASAQLKQSLEILCDACAPYKITVLLEAVCSLECNFITTTDEALTVVRSVQRDNIALVFDTYHAFMMNENDKPLRRSLDKVRLVHMAQNIDHQRHYLRLKNLPEYSVYIDALLDGGYDGEISVEAFNDDIESQLNETLDIMKILCNRSKQRSEVTYL